MMQTATFDLQILGRAIQIVSDARTLRMEPRSRRATLLDQLCKLIDADRWLWVRAFIEQGSRRPKNLEFQYSSGFPVSELIRFAYRSLGFPTIAPENKELARRTMLGTSFTDSIGPLLASENWCSDPRSAGFATAMNTEDLLFSIVPTERRAATVYYCGALIVRRRGTGMFGMEAKGITHLVMTNVEWLHATPPDGPFEEPIDRLTPRQRVILTAVLSGEPYQLCAEELEISERTMRDAASMLCSHFGVSSRTELMRKFWNGDFPCADDAT